MKNFSLCTIAVTVVMLTSGFSYYFLAPLNWGAGELVLDFHLWLGALFTIYLLYAVPVHIKKAQPKANNPSFVKLSYAMLVFFIVTLLTGLAHFIPYVSYYFTPVYYQFETYDLISSTHLAVATILIFLFATHLLIKHKEDK